MRATARQSCNQESPRSGRQITARGVSPGGTRHSKCQPRQGRKRSGPQSGFTLLEVLIATAILGIAVSALLGGFSGSLRNLSRAEGYERAVLLGREQLNRMLVEVPLRTGRTAGRWDESTRWEAEVTRWNPSWRPDQPPRREQDLPPVAVIRLTIFWKSFAGEKSVTLETSKYDPMLALQR